MTCDAVVVRVINRASVRTKLQREGKETEQKKTADGERWGETGRQPEKRRKARGNTPAHALE